MKTFTPDIDLDQEVKAMADFIAHKWTPISGLHELFRAIRDAALHDARGWIDAYYVGEHLHNLREARSQVLEAQLGENLAQRAKFYDAPCFFLNRASELFHKMRDEGMNLDGQWDYSRRVSRLAHAMRSRFEDLAQARPHGWDKLHENYQDFDGMQGFSSKEDSALFSGTKVDGAGSADFVWRTALPYVMYDEVCQGRKASSVLVGAVYAQFLGIAEQLHSIAVCKELDKLEGLYAPQMVFETALVSDNPFLKVVLALMDPPHAEDVYLQSEANHRAFEALLPEEKESRNAIRDLRIKEMIRQIVKDSSEVDELSLKVRAEMSKVFSA